MKMNETETCAAIILAAGKGTRMKSALPKVMHKIAHTPMVCHVIATAASVHCSPIICVISNEMKDLKQSILTEHSANFIIQDKQLGTGHAVGCAKPALKNYSGPVLILYGDTPLITVDTLKRMQNALKEAAVVVLGMHPDNPAEYGRLIVGIDNTLERIVEFKDATPEERIVTLCNSGVMAVHSKHLFSLIEKLSPNNAKGEYYLTDIIALARKEGLKCVTIVADERELLGVNSRAQLAEAEHALQQRLRAQAMENGVTLTDPASVFLAADIKLGKDVIIHPFVTFGPGVVVDDNVEIRSFCHIEKTHIHSGAIIGPYARLRPGSDIGENAHVGNFVEIKNSKLGKNAKANHHSYIGDATIGENSNIGAGTITCNYDGEKKYETTIGANVFVGSNTALIAPVTIGDGAYIGAGSVITKDVSAGNLALTRPEQVEKPAKKKTTC